MSGPMGLVFPVDKGSQNIWDTVLDTMFTTIESHDHTTGKGNPVPSSGLRINADVSWSFLGIKYAITDLRAAALAVTSAASVASLSGALFVNSADNELYFRNTVGTNVKVTNGSSLNISIVGGIGGDYASVGALLSFDDATDSYWLQQQGSPRPWARIRVGDVDIYETAASITNRVRLKSPSGLGASYDITLPTALPGATQLVRLKNNGVLSASTADAVSTSYIKQISAMDAVTTATGPTQASGNEWDFGTSVGPLIYPISININDTITGYNVYINKVSAAGTITARIKKRSANSGTITSLGAGSSYPSSSGFTTLQETGLSIVPSNQQEFFWIEVAGGGTVTGTTDKSFHADITFSRNS